jgi:hypothetical protein
MLSRNNGHVELAIAAGMVFFHLITINPNNARRFAGVAAIFLVLSSGVVVMFNYQKYGRFADELYMNDLYSPALRVSANKSVDQFLAESKQLKPKIDAERSKELRAAGEENGED